jgi:hypothetical protein
LHINLSSFDEGPTIAAEQGPIEDHAAVEIDADHVIKLK